MCFAAMRYTPTGEDKGYDVFLETARLLAREYDNIEFHVAGAFDEYVLPLKDLTSRVVFHGVLRGTQLQAFFQEMDIIVSPNLNGCIAPGTFDGFPTATCTEAGLNGVLILCTDPLGLNNGRFANGEEIEIIQRDAGAAAERIAYYYHHRDALREIVQRQGNRIRQLYSWNVQVGQRIRILEEEIACCPDNPDYVCSIPGERTITARIFFSPYPDYFSQEDMADFQLRFSKDGIFVGQFPLGDLNKPEQYLWIYLLNEAPCGIRFESIRYGDCLLAVKESSAQYVFDGTYYFNGQEQMIYLGSVKNLYPTEKYLILSGRMQKNPNLRLEAEQSGRMLCAGAVLHADKPERVAECAPIPFHYLLERDGRFSFDIELSQCPKDHGCLWLYFIANHSCSCRFDRITLNGQPLRITSSNGKQRLRKYVFDTIEPFLYFEGAPMVEEDNRLSVSGVIWIGS